MTDNDIKIQIRILIELLREVDMHINPQHFSEAWYQAWADRVNTAIQKIEYGG
jgi:hypothetical protein